MVGGDGDEQVERHAQQELDDQKDQCPQELAAHLFTHFGGHILWARSISAVLNRSVYELAGGEKTFRLLVERFYARVPGDEVLRAVYPAEALAGATERLTLFLIQSSDAPPPSHALRSPPPLPLP